MPSTCSRPLDRVWLWLLALALSLGAHLLVLLLPGATIVPAMPAPPPLQLSLSTANISTVPPPQPAEAPASAKPPHQAPAPRARAATPATTPAAPPRAHVIPATAPLSAASLLSQIAAGATSGAPAQQPATGGRLVYGSSARGYLWRQYIDDWVNKMERIGSLSYPQEVRSQGLSGGPTLSVVINADGSLAALRVTISSGNAVLDAAAEKIVRAAAPFAPFPPELSAQAQSLEIRRKWHFTTGNDMSLQ